jgi:outer membrane protein TolC
MRLWIFLFLLSPWPTFALTEDEVIKSVLDHFPLIEEAELKLSSSEQEVLAAEGAFDHKLKFKSRNRIEDKYDNQYFETILERQTSLKGINLVTGHRQGLGHFPGYDKKYKTSGAGEIFAGLSIPLLRNFSTDEYRTNLKIKNIEKEQSKEQLKLKKMIYIHKALSLYYKWVLESQKLKINRGIYELAKSRHEMIEKKFKAGDLEQFKVIDNLRAIDKRASELLKNEIELNKVRVELSLYVRDEKGFPKNLTMDSDTELKLKKPEQVPTVKNELENPQLEILRMEIEKLQADRDFYEQSKLPGLSVELLGSKELSPNPAYDPRSLQVGVSFDFPLENRKAEGKTVSSLYKIGALKKQRDFLSQELQRQIHFFISASSQSKERWVISDREFVNTNKMADAEKKRWLQGASDLFIVNLREQDVADADIRRWSALYDYHQYVLDAKLFSASFLNSL